MLLETQDYQRLISPYLEGSATTCSYCDKLDPLILLEGNYTYITIAIGQYVEGYLQLCTKHHRTAQTGLYDHETEELILMKRVIRETYKQVYGTPGVAFEHGKAGSCLWRNTQEKMVSLCHHCHVHFVPRAINIRDLIKEYISEEIPVHSIAELKNVRKDILESEAYLYFEDTDLKGYVYPAADVEIPRQFLRTCVAKELGVPERGDWVSYPGIEFYNDTKTKLVPVLQEVYQTLVK